MINCPLEIYSSSGFQDLLLNLRVSLRLPAVQTKGTRHVLSLQLLWMKYFASISRAKARCLQNACSALGFLQKQGSLQSERVLLDEATPEETSQIRRTLLYLTCKWESQHLPRAWPGRAGRSLRFTALGRGAGRAASARGEDARPQAHRLRNLRTRLSAPAPRARWRARAQAGRPRPRARMALSDSTLQLWHDLVDTHTAKAKSSPEVIALQS